MKSYRWRVVLSILVIILQILLIDAFVPKACVSNITVTGGSGVCCPIPKGGSEPCGGNGVGSCEPSFVQLEPLPKHMRQDDRMHWPSHFFKHTCKCEGNFFGVACDECWYGWEGPLCNKRHKVVRRNIFSYTPKEREMFVNIVAKTTQLKSDYLIIYEKEPIHSDPLWRPKFLDVDYQYLIAYWHEYASRGTLYHSPETCDAVRKIDNNHNVVGFATWHRYLMLLWERALRKIATDLYGWHDFAIPYWDWVDNTVCEVCRNDMVGAMGPWVNGIRLIHEGSPFSEWPENCSPPEKGFGCYGCHTSWPHFKPLHRHYKLTEFPTTDELQFALSRKTFYLSDLVEDLRKCRGFHQALEGFCGPPGSNSTSGYMHNKVHNMVAGSFCCASTAANDPIFILHHSQVDRIFQIWFQRYRPRPTDFPNHGVEPTNCRECNMVAFIPAVRHVEMFVDMRDLGIHYDNYDFGKHGFKGDKFIKYGTAAFV
ncbi:Tyrosinase [Fasciola gigantica]|uniref:Tyrosinase n=1 Tax=Fasciola gigantica TaxID=46835 RepID=A0A504YN21_FASGI|nr:Tyrosinase [Fasciola gigantica]